jgi:hypothetical protein
MSNNDEAVKAMTDLNGKEVTGRALKVNEATPPRNGAVLAAAGFGAAVVVAAADDFQSRTIANRPESRANPVGS